MSQDKGMEKVECTCPNCQERFLFPNFDAHVRKCAREESFEFPKYLTIASDPQINHLKQAYLSAGRAGILFDSGMVQVDLGDMVLEPDFTLRPIVPAEKALISMIADEHSASK